MASIVVTGASTGIGRGTVAHLSRQGHTVFAGVRRPEDGERLTADLGATVVPLLVDVTDPEQVAAAAATVTERVGTAGLDGLVNNAGIAVGGPLEHIAIDEVRRQLDVNVVAQVGVTQAMLPLIRRATGRIVFIGSLSGRVGLPMTGPYAASKFALEGLTESWRAELAPWGIKVVLIEPGSIKTEIWTKARQDADMLEREFPPEVVEQYRPHIAMVRTAIERQDRVAIPPSKVAKVVETALFASRPRARYLVGADAKVAGAFSRFLPDGLKASVIGLAGGTRLRLRGRSVRWNRLGRSSVQRPWRRGS